MIQHFNSPTHAFPFASGLIHDRVVSNVRPILQTGHVVLCYKPLQQGALGSAGMILVGTFTLAYAANIAAAAIELTWDDADRDSFVFFRSVGGWVAAKTLYGVKTGIKGDDTDTG